MNTYRLSVLKLLVDKLEATANQATENWNERKAQCEILLSLAACIEDIEKRLDQPEDIQVAEFEFINEDTEEEFVPEPEAASVSRKPGFRQQNFIFWQGFIEYAYENPEFAQAFNYRRPAPVQWLRFYWENPDNFCINAGYDRISNQLIARFDLRENLSLFSYFENQSEFEPIEEKIKDSVRYYLQRKVEIDPGQEESEVYRQLMELMLTVRQEVLAQLPELLDQSE